MKCENVQDLIAEYRSDMLDSRKRQEIEQHLAECEDCRRELEEFNAVMSLVEDNIPDLEPPVGLWNGVYNRINSPEPERSLLERLAGGWLHRPAQAVGVGAAMVVLVAGLWLGSMKPESHESVDYASSDNRYVQAHALTAGSAPFADRASYISYVAMSQESPSGERK